MKKTMKSHYEIVWGFNPPPVCTARWTNEDWTKYILGYRPNGYTGNAYDKKEYKQWQRGRQ